MSISPTLGVSGIGVSVSGGVSSSGVSAQSLRWFYAIDGITSKIQVPSITLSPVLPIELSFTRFSNSGAFKRFLGSDDFMISIDSGSSGDKFRLVGCTATLNGLPIVSDVTDVPTTNEFHALIITPTITRTISRFGSLSDGSRVIEATIFNIKQLDGDLFNFPVDDGPLAGGVVANLGSGGNGSVINEITGDWYEAPI